LPRSPFAAPRAGALDVSMSWLGNAVDDGVARSYRVVDHLGDTCLAGDCVGPDDSDRVGVLRLDPPNMVKGQRISIGQFQLREREREEQ
jgi:hypothetical protein